MVNIVTCALGCFSALLVCPVQTIELPIIVSIRVKAVTVMRGKTGIEVSLIIPTSELWATFLEIRPAPVHAPAHVIKHGDTGVWASVVRVVTNILTVLVGVITLEDAVTVVTV